MDFGIAKLLDSHTDLTGANIVGTWQYMSPEQMNTEQVDGRSDQYSLAVVAYELLTGRKVFDAKALGALCTMILLQTAPLASERNPGLPKAVDTVLGKALAKKATDRYGTCMEFVVALEASLPPRPEGPPNPSQDAIPTVTIPPVLIVKPVPKAGDVRVNEIDGQRYVWIPPGTFMMGASLGDTECDDDEKPAHEVTITKGFWMGETVVTAGAYLRFAQATGLSVEPRDESLPALTATWEEAASYCRWAGQEFGYRLKQNGSTLPGQAPPGRGIPVGKFRTLRGGYWDKYPRSARLSGRFRGEPVPGYKVAGFRCVWE